MTTMTDQATCRYCGRDIVNEAGRWIDPEATGDDSVWRETCQDHDTFTAEHEPTQTIWDMLEKDAPEGCNGVQDLYSWSLNYDAGKGPFPLFLDLIGWSDDNLGEPLFSLNEAPSRLGYVELSKLAVALTEYSDRPQDVRAYVDALMEAESSE